MRKIINNRKSIWFTVISTVLLFVGFISYPTNQSPQIVEAAQKGQMMITSSYEERRGRTVSLSVLVSGVEDVEIAKTPQT